MRASRARTAIPHVDAMVLIGAGNTFIAGADINIFKMLKTRDQSMARSAGTHALLRRLEDSAKPLVAAIHGQAFGGGLEVAMACHYRVAVKDAKVGQPEVLLGIIPGAGGTQRLPRLAGAPLAIEMCTDGKPVAASKAKAAGILDEIVEGDLRSGAVAFAKARAAAGERRKTREVAISAEQVAAGRAACQQARGALAKIGARRRARRSRRSTPSMPASSWGSTTDRSGSASSSPSASSRPNRRRCVISSLPSAKRPRCPTSPRRPRRSTSGVPRWSARAPWAAASP